MKIINLSKWFIMMLLLLTLTACSSYDTLLEEPLQAKQETAAVSIEINPKINEKANAPSDLDEIAVKYVSAYDADTYTFQLINSNDRSKIKSLSKNNKNTIKVRALLVDASEIKGKDDKPEPFAIEARDAARELLEQASNISLSYDIGARTDHYDRNLMYVKVDGILLSIPLLEEGLLQIAYVKPPNTKYLTEYEKAQEIAKAKNLGLWSLNYK
ncbi:thermonuclease family protein [Lysinibacillus fusiformis]|uniref:thermonuclease family protein n=1 Tax=Lysinibacillus fusiformis TaxID=28031 RepID=UPI00068CA561|nr:thermonuclease family protein [Lysinibacillus fusiformis]